jgi:hypothetical protein
LLGPALAQKRKRSSRNFIQQVKTAIWITDSFPRRLGTRRERASLATFAAGGSPTNPELKNVQAERRLARSLQKLRLLRAVRLATAALDARPEPSTKTRRRIVDGEEVWREESQANSAPVNLYALQNYVLAVKALESFDREEQLQASTEPIVPPQTLADIFNLLCRFRCEAEAAGQVNNSGGDVYGLVVTTLNYLLGVKLNQHRSEPSQARAQLEQDLSALSENGPDATLDMSLPSDDAEAQDRGEGGRGT